MSNKVKRSERRRSGEVIPDRERQVGRRRAKAPTRGLFESIERRLKANLCPVCGAALKERSNPKKPEVCLNDHPQDVWKSQRPQAAKA